jgi:hypothetical protein
MLLTMIVLYILSLSIFTLIFLSILSLFLGCQSTKVSVRTTPGTKVFYRRGIILMATVLRIVDRCETCA